MRKSETDLNGVSYISHQRLNPAANWFTGHGAIEDKIGGKISLLVAILGFVTLLKGPSVVLRM